MTLKNLACLAAGIAAGTMLIGAQAAWAQNGTIQGVVSDASGQPVVGAFVKVKNDEKRLTFMVISQERGQFSFKDLPVGTYRVQGVGNGMQSEWFPDVKVASGVDAKVGVSLNVKQGTALPPAWPQRIPEADVLKASKDAKDLPAGDGKELVAERCTSCHDVLRIVVKRSNEDDWSHTVERMRTRMAIALQPDLSQDENSKIVKYLVAHFGELQPYDANSRLPRTVMTGKALHYRAVTYALENTHAEPHDVAVDPKGNPWVSERAGKLGKLDMANLSFTEYDTPPGPASKDRQSSRQSADRFQGHPLGR